MNGTYEEKLPFSEGKLIVTKTLYKIQFYFSGPDLRYNGTWLRIWQHEIDDYVDAYQKNWKKYIDLKKMKEQLGNSFSTTGIKGMNINIGGFRDGVCIKSYHMPIRTEKELKKLIDSFHWAKDKGPKVMSFLKSV